jgi:hypothetical protein
MLAIRKYKIFGLSIFDIVVGVIGTVAIFLGMWRWHFRQLKAWNFVLAGIVLTIPIGIAVHIIFGSNTTLNYKLGLSGRPDS